ncbi:MAG: hypothetical protein O7D32_09675 [bacterium]|nr:hypothetical protein [bacterium]
MVTIALLVAGVCLSDVCLGASYTVTVNDDNPKTIHVSGEFALESSTIAMYITRSPQLEDGQAALVRNLVIKRADGEPVTYEYAGIGDWTLAANVGDIVHVDYDVLLEHDRYDWGPGIDEVAYRQDDGLFFTGASLFIVPGHTSTHTIDVRFDLPSGWKASTPWPSVEMGTYSARNVMDLVRNCLFMGTHLEETVTIGDFTFILAVGDRFKSKLNLFVEAMAPLLPAYVEMFGGMPSESRYLVVINPGNRSDGGAFPGSYSMLIRGEVNRTSSAVWGHGIAHELLHFWNGHTIAPASSSDEEWFKEGFTDYLTILSLSRTGLDPRETTYRKLENSARRYIIAKKLMDITDSMRAAGAEKHRKRFLVYGGGTLVAFALDIRIREATENAKGIDELMSRMYAEFGATGNRYSYEDIVRIATEVSGKDQSEFFGEFVDGTGFLDIGPYCESIGLQLTTMMDEFYIAEFSEATPAQRAIIASMLGTRGAAGGTGISR